MLGKLDSIKISDTPKKDYSKGWWSYKNPNDAGDNRKVWRPNKYNNK